MLKLHGWYLLIQAGPIVFDFPLVTALTAFIALPVKFLVDVVKRAWQQAPDGLLPFIGIAIAFLMCLVVLVAGKVVLDASVYAQCAIAAVGAQIAAMAATWNQNGAQRVNEKIQAAIDAPKGTSVQEVKDQVANK